MMVVFVRFSFISGLLKEIRLKGTQRKVKLNSIKAKNFYVFHFSFIFSIKILTDRRITAILLSIINILERITPTSGRMLNQLILAATSTATRLDSSQVIHPSIYPPEVSWTIVLTAKNGHDQLEFREPLPFGCPLPKVDHARDNRGKSMAVRIFLMTSQETRSVSRLQSMPIELISYGKTTGIEQLSSPKRGKISWRLFFQKKCDRLERFWLIF